MKILSQTSKYGLRSMLYLASKYDKGEFVNIKEIAAELELSFHFLTKIFRSLTHKGMLTSYKGPNGGIALTQSPKNIMLIEIITALEGEEYFDQCMLGLKGCGISIPCPVHDFWTNIKTEVKTHLATTSLKELGEKVKTEKARLLE